MLFIGSAMSRSLLNQNPIRDYIWYHKGRIQDDFTRDDEEFRITVGNTFIPFYMDGSAVCFDSRVPSSAEIESLPHVTITSSKPWDPKNKLLRVSAASPDYNYHRSQDGTGGHMETMGNSKGNNGLTGNNYGNYYGNNIYGNNTGTNYGNNYGNFTETKHENHGNIMGTYGNCAL